MSLLSSSNWYAVRCATRQELRAAEGVREQGIVAYLPTETVWRDHARKVDRKAKALFPGYMFAQVSPGQVHQVLETDGVSQIIGGPTDINRRGLPVPKRGLAWLVAAEHMGAFNRTIDPPEPTYAPGRKVRVRSGKLTGALGEIMEAKGQKRFFVAIEYFGRIKRIEIDRSDLEVAA